MSQSRRTTRADLGLTRTPKMELSLSLKLGCLGLFQGRAMDSPSRQVELLSLGSRAVSQSSKKQSTITLSILEAEFVTVTTCACQVIWLRNILEELHFKHHGPTQIYCNSSSTIKLSKNPFLHRSEHIDMKYQDATWFLLKD